MQSLIKTCALPIVLLGFTACGGGGGGSKSAPTPMSSSAAQSSVPASSADASSSAASSTAVIAETTQTAVNYTGYSVAKIDNCGSGVSAQEKTYKVFADYDAGIQNQALLNFSGWNHANNENKDRPEWTKLNVSTRATYDFFTSAKVDDSCSGVDAINMVFLKKIADWDLQHSNGFEKTINADAIEFGDIENLVIDLKINSAKTSLPSVEALKTTYASYVSGDVIDTLEAGKVNIGIVMYDGKTATVLSASRIIELDQAAFADQWIRVTVPMKDLKFCSTTNYSCTDKTLADLSNKVIAGIQFVGETKTGKVLRNHISNWSTSTPETFKEMDISIKKIEFQLK